MLEVRAAADEIMDDPALDPVTYRAVLDDLARVNRVTLAHRPTLAFLARAVRNARHIRLLDVGFGQGDMLRRIAAWAAARGIGADLVGIDLNPRSAPVAAAATPPGAPIVYRTGDYRDLGGEQWDVIVSSLVAHHMTEAQLQDFLRFMDAHAARGWFVNDLFRHGFAYRGYPLLARLMGWHEIVRLDGQLSIARAYRPAEWAPLLDGAGVSGARVFRAFPFRLCVERIR